MKVLEVQDCIFCGSGSTSVPLNESEIFEIENNSIDSRDILKNKCSKDTIDLIEYGTHQECWEILP